MPRPLIRCRRGIWSCRARWNVLVVGLGYTPRAAYDDWLAQWNFVDIQQPTQ